MSDEAIVDLMSRHKRLKADRAVWESHCQDVAEVMLPGRADFVTRPTPGGKRTERIYDGLPMLARRSLATAVDELLKPKTAQWLAIKPSHGDDQMGDEAKRWLEAAQDAMFRALYSPRAAFVQRSGEVDNDLVSFGVGFLFVGENRDRTHLAFRSIHPRDAGIAENSDGVIDTVMVDVPLTARAAVQRYGEGSVGDKTRELVRDGKPDQICRFLWVIQPREDYEGQRGALALPWRSCVIDLDSQHLVLESGYEEWPFAIPRWDLASGEVYARGPGMTALPDALTLQAMGLTILTAGEKAANPPLLAASDGAVGVIRTYPGGISYYSADAAQQLGGRPPISPLDMRANIPITLEMQRDIRQQVENAFYINQLRLPVDRRDMTAYEVAERRGEMIQALGPVFGKLESDYLSPIAERVFGIMMRASMRNGWRGPFPPPPRELQGASLRFEFGSPLQHARKQVGMAGLARALELTAPLAAADPAMLDHVDKDEVMRSLPDSFGFPQRLLLPKDQVEAMRAQRADMAKGQRLIEAAGKIAPALKDGAGAAQSLAGMMAQRTA